MKASNDRRENHAQPSRPPAPRVRMLGRHVRLPRSKPLRVGLGGLLLFGGMLGFLPVLGYWMVPVGLVILSVDFAPVRRFRRRMELRLVPGWRRLVARFSRSSEGR
jgi:hypothetical protein